MKRRLFKLVVFLIFGAIVNIAVAWGCAWKLDVYQEPVLGKSVNIAGEVGKTPNHMWSVHRYNCTGATRVFSYYFSPAPYASYDGDPGSLLPPWNQGFFSGIGREDLGNLVRIQDGRGWPKLALWGQAVADDTMLSIPYCKLEYAILITDFTNPTRPLMVINGGSLAGVILRRVQFLPLNPIWLGFAINTVFYASILWLLTLVPFSARQMIRRKRGRCNKCGYDLRGDFTIGCPECGWGREAEA